MTAIIKSNKAGTASSIYPSGMESFMARARADGATFGDEQELYYVFKALDDQGLAASASVLGVVSAQAVKVAGGFVSKLYSFYGNNDFLPVNAAAGQTTLDTSLSTSMIAMAPGAGSGVARAVWRPANPTVMASETIGLIAAFTLNNPTVQTESRIIGIEDTAATVNRASLLSSPNGNGNSRIGLLTYDPSLANFGYAWRQNLYSARRMFGGLHGGGMKNLFQDGVCQARNVLASGNYYKGKSLTPAIGNENAAPDFKLRLAIWLNGDDITQAKFKALQAALAAALA